MYKRIGVLVCCVCSLLLLAGCSGKKNGLIEYDDFDQFNADCAYDFYLPDGAEDLRMAADIRTFSKAFFYSYVLDDEEMEELVEKTVIEKYTIHDDDGNEVIELDKYYGVQVKDIDNVEYIDSDDFVHGLNYNSVIDDSVEDYYVLYYYPTLVGSHTEGILYNKETNRVLVYSYSTIK